jgi:hypothetical protein
VTQECVVTTDLQEVLVLPVPMLGVPQELQVNEDLADRQVMLVPLVAVCQVVLEMQVEAVVEAIKDRLEKMEDLVNQVPRDYLVMVTKGSPVTLD